MKLGRQGRARGYMVAAAGGVLLGFFALVRAEPRTKAQTLAPTGVAPIDYQGFFAPSASGADASVPATPHTQTRAS